MLESLFNKVTGLQACNFTKKRLQHRRFPVNIANFKNTYFEKHLRTAGSDSSYILHRKLNKIIQEADWPSRLAFCFFWNIKSLYFTYSHSHSFVLSIAVIPCHSLSFFVTRCHSLSLVVTCCQSLSLVVPLVVTRCHSLYHSLSLVVIRCHSLYHSLSFVVTRCTTRLSFYKRSNWVAYNHVHNALCFPEVNKPKTYRSLIRNLIEDILRRKEIVIDIAKREYSMTLDSDIIIKKTKKYINLQQIRRQYKSTIYN